MLAASSLRKVMVDTQIAARGVRNSDVLKAMREVPRERFVPTPLGELAYEDRPLPIEAGQTISQPYIVARMIEAAELSGSDRALEIGAGSGYAAAVMSRIAGQVHAIERHAELAELARQRMAALGYANVEIRTGDGTEGWPEAAPFDAILIAAAGPSIPNPLCRQLAIGGRLVMPVGSADAQRLVRVTRRGEDLFDQDDLGNVCFVPLIGTHGWMEDAATDALVEPLPRDPSHPPVTRGGDVLPLFGECVMNQPTSDELLDQLDHPLILSSRVIKTPVFNGQGDLLGHVDNLSIEKESGRVIYAIMSFGGFLGIGEKFHPLPWSLLDYDIEREGFIVPLDRSILKGAPSYDPKEIRALGGPDSRVYGETIFGYYGPYGAAPY